MLSFKKEKTYFSSIKTKKEDKVHSLIFIYLKKTQMKLFEAVSFETPVFFILQLNTAKNISKMTLLS